MSKLSVVIITFNEAENIAKCIESVKDIADEVFVLDSFSTDATCDIARSMGARVEQHHFDGHIQQKNRAKNAASYKMVLSLDADETLSAELKESLKREKENHFPFEGYFMNRLNFYCGKPIKTCGWYPDKKMRLWNRELGNWTGRNPHDRFELTDSLNTGYLSGDILHNTYPTHEAMLKQVNKFAEISAKNLVEKSNAYLWFKLLFATPFKFVRSYFLKLGFTDGRAGFLISWHQTREVFMKYRLAIKLKVNSK